MYSVTIKLQRVACILLCKVVCYSLFRLVVGALLKGIGCLGSNTLEILNFQSYFAMKSCMLFTVLLVGAWLQSIGCLVANRLDIRNVQRCVYIC